MHLEQFIVAYGYPALFLGTFFEGETFLIMGGFLAHRGYLDLPLVIVAAFAGAIAGDQTFFFLGRRKGIEFLERRPSGKPKVERLRALLRTHGVAVILGFRFLYGLRMVTPFLLGTSGVSPCRFAVLNAVGAATWSVLIGYLGYSLGLALEFFLVKVKRYELLVLGGIAAAGAAAWIVHFCRERKRR